MKLKLLMLTSTLAVTSFHCSDCGDDVLPYFDAKGISGTEIWNVTSATKSFSYSENRVINANNLLGISFFFDANYYTHRRKAEVSYSLIGSALACDPQPNGYKGSKESFKSIMISSDQLVDVDHPTGTSLNDLFQIKNEEQAFVSLQQFLSQKPGLFNPNFELLLSKRLQTGKSFSFKIIVELTNGEIYETLTSPVVFE